MVLTKSRVPQGAGKRCKSNPSLVADAARNSQRQKELTVKSKGQDGLTSGQWRGNRQAQRLLWCDGSMGLDIAQLEHIFGCASAAQNLKVERLANRWRLAQERRQAPACPSLDWQAGTLTRCTLRNQTRMSLQCDACAQR